MTVGEWLRKEYAEEMKKWDGWDYRVYGPMSLDDLAQVAVVLINKDESSVRVVLAAAG